MTTLAVHCARATNWSCYRRGHEPLPLSTSLSFAVWGPSSTPAHQRPLLRHVGTLPQFVTGSIHRCPFNASLETQLMSSFVYITAHLAATGGTELTMNPKLRSHSRESVYKGPDYSCCRDCSRFQGSVTRAWAKVTPQLF